MGSVSRIFTTDGSQFGGVVPAVDEVTATAPARKVNVPDSTIAVLMELQGSTPADRAEWNDLVSKRHTLNQMTIVYIERQLAARHADLEQKHEAAKIAVREQGNVLEDLKKTLIEQTQEFVRAQNRLSMAQSAAHAAEVEYKSLS